MNKKELEELQKQLESIKSIDPQNWRFTSKNSLDCSKININSNNDYFNELKKNIKIDKRNNYFIMLIIGITVGIILMIIKKYLGI